MHKYVFQCTNIFSSAQIYFQCTNVFFSAQNYSWHLRPWDYTVIEAWSRCLPRFRFRSVSSQIEAIFDRSSIFCRNCGKGLESSFAFCPNCGAKVEAETSLSSRDNIVGSVSLTSQTSRKRASPSEPAAPGAKQFPTFRQFLDRKSEEQRGHFKQTKKATQASCEATINVALMEYEGDVLKPVRGSSLPLKVEVRSNYNDVKDAAIKKPLIVPLMLKGVMY